MALYDKPVRLLMREMIDELAPTAGVVFTRQQALRWFAQHYPKVKDGTVSAHLLRFSTNSPSRHHYSPRPDEELLFQLDGGRFRRHDPANDPAPFDGRDAPVSSDDAEAGDVSPEPSQFAYESDLRDFLARNLSIVEPGM